MGIGTIDNKPIETCKVEEMSGGNAPDIEGEINNKLKQGWTFKGTIVKSNKIYLIFIK